jgi:Flp pilus assembly pilin Flp
MYLYPQGLGAVSVRVLKNLTMMMETLRILFRDERGQDIAEYAVMLAVILIIVVGTIKLIGSSATNTFSNVASTLSQ